MEDLIIKKDCAECYEVKEKETPNDNCLRFWCCQFPNIFKLQIRTHKAINNSYNTGKPRNMIAHVNLSIEELEQMLEYAKNYKLT